MVQINQVAIEMLLTACRMTSLEKNAWVLEKITVAKHHVFMLLVKIFVNALRSFMCSFNLFNPFEIVNRSTRSIS